MDYQPIVNYDEEAYVHTFSGNKVSRQSVLCGAQNIHLKGKCIIAPGAILRGDFSKISAGRFCSIGANTVLRPSQKLLAKGLGFFPMSLGDHVYIGSNTIVQATNIGSHVYIGDNCVIGKGSVLRDCCRIEDDTILPADSVVAPFTLVSGQPAQRTGELPESTPQQLTLFTTLYYDHFRA